MYPSLWGGFPWFNVKEESEGAYYSCYFPLYQLSSWLICPLAKSIILVIGESPTTHIIECFQIEKWGNTTWYLKFICFSFQKNRWPPPHGLPLGNDFIISFCRMMYACGQERCRLWLPCLRSNYSLLHGWANVHGRVAWVHEDSHELRVVSKSRLRAAAPPVSIPARCHQPFVGISDKDMEVNTKSWHLEIFHIIECFQIEKRGNTTWYLKFICFSFQKILFCDKIKLTKKWCVKMKDSFALIFDFIWFGKIIFFPVI